MPHGAPDWSNVVKYYQVHRLDDMAELACRLESIVRYDRRGDVIFCDSFDYGLSGWWVEIDGSGAEVSLETKYSRSKGISAKLTAGSDSDRYARITRLFPYIFSETFGAEVSFTYHEFTDYIQLHLGITRDFIISKFVVRYSIQDLTIKIRIPGGWKTIAEDYEIEISPYFFHSMKVVGNAQAGEYERLLFDGDVFSLKGISADVGTTTLLDRIEMAIENKAVTGYNPIIYIDDIIITQNEP